MILTQPITPLPFRKRRPFLFWFIILFVLILVAALASRLLSSARECGLIGGPRLAVLNVEGVILDATDTLAWAERLRRDKSVAGVLVRVNSPGGAVGPSQELHRAVKRLAESGKPVVVSMGAVAASGGYYVAVAGKEIYASPSTLTGSIGVKLQTPNMEGLMHALGIKEQTLTTGKLKDAGSPYRAMSEEEKRYLTGLIDDMQQEFVRAVAEGRNLSPEEVRPLADGRAFTGRQALDAKLIDKLGDKEDALTRLGELSGVTERPEKLLEGPKKETPLWRKLVSSLLGIELPAGLGAPSYGFYYF